MWCAAKSLVIWFVMLAVIRNLTGLTLQSIADRLQIDRIALNAGIHHSLKGERLRLKVMTWLFAGLTFGTMVALYRYWNWQLCLAAVMIWLGAIPDHLWSAQTGRPTREAPQSPIRYIEALLTFGAMTVAWWAMC